MGATTFYEIYQAATPEIAFTTAISSARYLNGHGGYTGTIAEKHSFTIATTKNISDQNQAYHLAESLIDTKYSDKWGPAGCIPIIQPNTSLKKFLFFGWASN
jgi:hypothetical protein